MGWDAIRAEALLHEIPNRSPLNAMMDPSSSSTASASAPAPAASTYSSDSGGPAAALSAAVATASRRFQHLLDRSTPHVGRRWLGLAGGVLVYALRAWFVGGYYIVTYALGIYLLNLLIAFLSPQVDPELAEVLGEGPALPTRSSDEFRPFVRRLPEFKFWYSIVKAFCIAFGMTFFSVFDVPVFWPILLFYWVVLFTVTMKRQILHMVKYRYVPFTFGKQRYNGKRAASADDLTLPKD
ncbi:protein RER1A-like [Triticum dicoccoides]|uniref:protein RER1A-like n=1 Tax=Triticum dicoccoides TaxID=85692 RepID=UPI001891AB92|nr:protein RER1A-like [Triticum dicoccoides]XP_044422145.1 protein RER1A-like [Triticum aestivum]